MLRMSIEERLQTLVPEAEAESHPRVGNAGVIVLFTPRSGSTWLCDLLRRTRLLGDPQEYLNQDLFQFSTKRFRARTETNYLNMIETLTATHNRRYCITATWGQIGLSTQDFLGRYADAKFIYLRRRDILSQAVSLYLAITTGRFHRRSGDDRPLELPEIEWSSDVADAIGRWWAHILAYESLADIQFAVRGMTPLRLYYEDLVSDTNRTVRDIFDFCGVRADRDGFESRYEPVTLPTNALLYQNFMADRAELAATLNSFRPPLVS
jgi:trehalose 2-sulfotransferase